MDATLAALITVLGPTLLVGAHQVVRRWRRRRARRRRIAQHIHIIADSLLVVTMRVDELEDRMLGIELALRLPSQMRPRDFE